MLDDELKDLFEYSLRVRGVGITKEELSNAVSLIKEERVRERLMGWLRGMSEGNLLLLEPHKPVASLQERVSTERSNAPRGRPRGSKNKTRGEDV